MQYIYEQFVDYVRQDDNQAYAHCPLHDGDNSPSFTVNMTTGEWYCHACECGGAEKEFLARYFDVPSTVAKYVLDSLHSKGVIPFPSDEEINKMHNRLMSNERELNVLRDFGISDDIIKEFRLGLDDLRIAIPIESNKGFVVNIRKYLPPYRRTTGATNAKCISLRNLGVRRYFPYKAFRQSKDIYIVEGEKDCLVARSLGINAVTSTGGSAIPTDEIMYFRGKNVYLMLDSDTVGKRSTKSYCKLLRGIADSVWVVNLPSKDFADFYQEYKTADVSNYTLSMYEVSKQEEQIEALDTTLVRSEFSENLNTWIRLKNMSVLGADPKIYSIPSKLKVQCNNAKCTKPCPLSMAITTEEMQTVTLEPRQLLQFVNSPDSAQDSFLKKMFGCTSVVAEPIDMVNVQNLLFQESASFLDGMEESSSDSRFGLYVYTDYRLNPTMKYNFEACRVTDPKTQKNFYVIRTAENIAATKPAYSDDVFKYFRDKAKGCTTFKELMSKHYTDWMAALSIEGRLDLFCALMLTYASVTEIPYNYGTIKGWLDIMVIGDTRTGKSQMAQRMCRELGMGGYINGENSRVTGVIGGVQKVGDAWMITWGAIPMNDKGLLFVDEASGLEIEDIKNLSSTRSAGAVTLNKIIKGEARARTRIVWMSNPRSGRNISDFYWKGFGAFQEYIPVMEDQARYDLVLTAAREDIDILEGIEETSTPNIEVFRSLFSTAWNLSSNDITLELSMRKRIKEFSHKLNDEFGGSSLIVGVAVHEKLLRVSCAVAVLCGDVYDNRLAVNEKHLEWAYEFIRTILSKPSLGFKAFITDMKRAERKKKENIEYIKAQLKVHPALRALMCAESFRGSQLTEVLGITQFDSYKYISDFLMRGLLKAGKGGMYIPDKLLLEVAREEELFNYEY